MAKDEVPGICVLRVHTCGLEAAATKDVTPMMQRHCDRKDRHVG